MLWIDFFRGAAVLVMIETHVVNTFLAATVRADSWFAILNYLNGLVAPSFLFIAGFVQGMERRACRAGSKPGMFARRGRRLLGIGLIGYALHLPWTELGQRRWADAVRVGTQVDVLQCIAASLGLLLIVNWLAERAGKQASEPGDRVAAKPGQAFAGQVVWWLGAFFLLVAFVGFAPTMSRIGDVPVPLLAWLNESTGSWFPLFPWAGFVFAGAMAGALASRFQPATATTPATLPVARKALPGWIAAWRSDSPALWALPVPLAFAAWTWRDAHYSRVGLSSFLERLAWVLVLAAFCEWLAARRRLPRLVLFAGRHSLTLYVVHLVLISNLVTFGVLSQSMSLSTVGGLILAVGVVSVGATWGIVDLRGRAAEARKLQKVR